MPPNAVSNDVLIFAVVTVAAFLFGWIAGAVSRKLNNAVPDPEKIPSPRPEPETELNIPAVNAESRK